MIKSCLGILCKVKLWCWKEKSVGKEVKYLGKLPCDNSIPFQCIQGTCVHSHFRLFAAPQTLAHQATLSIRLSWQEYWNRFSFACQGIFPDSGSNISACITSGLFTVEPPGKPISRYKAETQVPGILGMRQLSKTWRLEIRAGWTWAALTSNERIATLTVVFCWAAKRQSLGFKTALNF